MAQSRLIASLTGAFHRPFRGLAFFVWGFFVWCYLVHPDSAILRGSFGDSDDAVHLTRVVEWLQGQNWFDPFLHRLAPPEGVAIHYSRLAELPLAALIAPLHALGLSWVAAATSAAAVWPLVLFAFFLGAVRFLAARFASRDFARASAYVVLFALPVTMEFSPGRVDHHGLALMLVALALGFIVRLMERPDRARDAVAAGFLLALGQAIALETLPWLLALSGWVGFWLMMKGRGFAKAALVFGASLYVFAAFFLVVTVAPAAYGAMNLLAYSALYVAIAGAIAVALTALVLASLTPWAFVRWLVGFAAAGLCFAGFLTRFPALAAGPYGGMDPALAKVMFAFITEAVPLIKSSISYGSFFGTLFMPLLGLGASLAFMMKAEGDEIWKWCLASLLLLAAIVLTVFYQVRVELYANLFALAPLTALLERGLASVRATYRGRKMAYAELYLLLLVGPLAGVLIPASSDTRSFSEGVLLFPVTIQAHDACVPAGLWQVLNLPSLYGDRPHRIMNMMNEGALILFHTKHEAMAAPYHTNVRGNLDSLRFFQAHKPEEALAIARQDKIDLVLTCEDLPTLYKAEQTDTRVWQDGTVEKGSQTFAQQLVAGQVPAWLKRVEMPFLGKARLYEVQKEAPRAVRKHP